MAEQRLIDANNLGIGMAYQSEFYPNYFAIGWNSALKAVTEISPTIDPETLPIVRQLREELERVTAERDAVVESIPHECKTCVYHTVFFNGCTLDHDCTNPDGGCSNNYDRWRWRGRKED